MIRSIVDLSIRRRYAVVVMAAVIVAIGLLQIRDARIDSAPEFSPTFVEVQTEALGLSAAEVEQLITVPLEQDLLNGVAWVETIHSRSIPGLSSVVMTFEPGTNMLDARQMVQERLTQAHALPNVSDAPAMVHPVSSTSRVMMIGLSSDEHSLIDQSVLARWTIRPRLLSVPGVANVSIWGQRERQLQVLVDPQQLAARDIPLIDVVSSAGNALWVSPLTFLDASTPGTGGFIETPNQRIGVRHVLPISTPEDLARISLEGQAGSLTLGDVATVVEGHQPLIGDAIVDGGEGLILVVEKLPWASTTQVTEGVDAALRALAPGLTGITVDPTIFRPASYVEEALDNGSLALLSGLILLVIALALLFFQWRYALVSALAIVTALVAATLALILVGTTLNLVVLAGLVAALGVIVDDGIVDIEAYRRTRSIPAESGETTAAATTAASLLATSVSVRSAMAFGAVIALLVLVPVLFTDGEAGALMPPLVAAYAIAIVVSIVVALTLTPALSAILLTTAGAGDRGMRVRRSIGRGYLSALRPLVRIPATGLVGAGVALLVGLFVLPTLSVTAAPQFRDRDLLIGLQGAPGVAQAETRRLAGQVSSELATIEGVERVGAHVGRAILSDETTNVDHGEIWVGLSEEADYEATLARIAAVLTEYPGFELEGAQAYANDRIADILGVADEDVVVRVYGEDLNTLRAQVDAVVAAVAATDGVVAVESELPPMEPAVEIEVDLAAAQAAGIKPGDVRRSAAMLLSGINVGSLFEEQKVFGVVVWGTPNTRQSITAVEDLIIDRPEGGHVRLGQVADVRVAANPQVIQHDAVRRFADVVATVEGRDPGAVAADLETTIAGLAFPLDYHAEIMTPSADRQSATLGVVLVSAAALFGVFLLMQAALSSWRGALLATLATLLSAVGGLVAVRIIGGTVSIGAVAGFLGILALASRYMLMLLLRFGDLRSAQPQQALLETVLRGSVDRLAPIVMTAIVIAAALLPILVLGPDPGFEVVYPLAAVVVGGLITAVLVSLFVTPPLYLLLEGRTLPRAEMTEESGLTSEHQRGPLPEGSLSVSQRRLP